MNKIEINEEQFIKKTFQIVDMINDSKSFFFYFSPDPDAIGVSIALALFFNSLEKKSIVYLPSGYDYNLNFLIKIAEYNHIKIINDVSAVIKHLKKEEFVFVTCDTPTYRLLPDYKKIFKVFDGYIQKKSIEIDHHFGGDSEQIYSGSETIFFQANSCCDMIADFFQIISNESTKKNEVVTYFPRNIVLSLLVGMCYDTQFGKFLVNENNYNKWFNFLSDRLNNLTWGQSSHMRTASEVFDTINKMSEMKLVTMSNLVDGALYKNGVGLLILPMIGKYESLAENGDSSCILNKISSDIANMLPESAGKIGVFCYYDDIKKQYLVKIRRSSQYKGLDLRNFENDLKKLFSTKYIGGGGHPGATSFRMSKLPRTLFIKKMNELFEIIIISINNSKD